jgi:hypothetical protein
VLREAKNWTHSCKGEMCEKTKIGKYMQNKNYMQKSKERVLCA